jgi:hypothetical protein
MSDFNLSYSENYQRLKAAVEAARKRVFDSGTLSSEEWERRHADFGAVIDALHETDEWKFLNEIQAVESQSYHEMMDAEAVRRGRMISVLSFEEPKAGDYPNMAEAIADAGFSDVAIDGPVPGGGLLTVFADMRRLSAANVATILRAMAEKIEQDGVVVYQGATPFEGPCTRWMVNECIYGGLVHNTYKSDGAS